MDAETVHSFDVQKLREVIDRNIKLCNYECALYWADKVMSLTSDDVNDVLVCASCLHQSGQYHRAIGIVKSKTDFKTNARSVLLIGNCYYACKDYELTVSSLTDFLYPPDVEDCSMFPRYPSRELQADETLLSAMHLLLGKAYEANGNYELASDEFKKALMLDVYCHEAFDKVIGHHLLTASEEQVLLEKLPFDSQCGGQDNSTLVRTLYGMQVKKYVGHETLGIAAEVSALSDNLDVVVSLAERLYYNCYFRDAFKITAKVLEKEPFHLRCLPLHIALLVELHKPNELFYLAHQLVDTYPMNVVSWFGVACYYHLINNNDMARQYFSKATTIDPLFGPAWLAFGHSFAAESEHDQAMAAYFRASHLMKGCHLPFLYIGLEYGLTSTTKLAEKFFVQAQAIAPKDPFVVHEVGVIAYQNGRYIEAEENMRQALVMIDSLDLKRISHIWEPLLNNIAHVCRKLRKYEEAISYHKKALTLRPKNASSFSAIGYNYMLMFDFTKAVEFFHKALAVRKNDSFTNDLLKVAIEELVNDMSNDTKAQEICEPVRPTGKLNFSLLAEGSPGLTEDHDESVPNTPRDAAALPHAPGDSSTMSMDMSMEDL
ncbi:cell division cycle protein 16 homolog [Watersipora subatra]|uniref:cell division cycle protein 16 homolog n=1 Tax=Watersipora subatra TaxID=2589382 RepID=UPI00355B8D17